MRKCCSQSGGFYPDAKPDRCVTNPGRLLPSTYRPDPIARMLRPGGRHGKQSQGGNNGKSFGGFPDGAFTGGVNRGRAGAIPRPSVRPVVARSCQGASCLADRRGDRACLRQPPSASDAFSRRQQVGVVWTIAIGALRLWRLLDRGRRCGACRIMAERFQHLYRFKRGLLSRSRAGLGALLPPEGLRWPRPPAGKT